MRLLHFFAGHGSNHVNVVLRGVKLGLTFAQRWLHWQWSFGQRFQIGSIINTKTLTKIAKDQWTVFFDLQRQKISSPLRKAFGTR